ncbi:GGDEF domain-containing protein [Noviherbaspirillum galbum]|uniref:diguanylate cyclase n=1 Tax=Noviherbaspirillum galbum TaxID=2709383 RepID=A0A6B3SUW6_9BURK|nr:diguanylate cyclase [Noviherbaspirillum galbum]NEX64288.1 diguanylate cyclase [Noviherbaspirillum galbum]
MRRQPHRIYMSGLVVFNMLIETGMLGLFALAGTIKPWIVVAFAGTVVPVSIAIHLMFRIGLNLRLKEKGLLVPQLAVNAAAQLIFLMLAPQLAVFFMLTMIAFSGYAAPEFSPRSFTNGWLVFGVLTGAAIWLVRDRFRFPGASGLEIFATWLFFFLALRSLTLASARFFRLRAKLSEKNRQLEASLRQIEELASHDHLTGINNRGTFMKMLEDEAQRSARTGAPFCFVMLDIDHFKKVNDTHGHPVGDEVLKTVCDIAVRTLRGIDRIGRLGGEEFGILLPDTRAEEGTISMERLREAVNDHDWGSIAPGLDVHFSAGITSYMPMDNVQKLAKRADDALYHAKETGRDRVVMADQRLSARACA